MRRSPLFFSVYRYRKLRITQANINGFGPRIAGSQARPDRARPESLSRKTDHSLRIDPNSASAAAVSSNSSKADSSASLHHVIREGKHCNVGVVYQAAKGCRILGIVARHHRCIGGVGSSLEDLLVLFRQLVPLVEIDLDLERWARLPPAGEVVEAGGFVEAQLLVIVRGRPTRRRRLRRSARPGRSPRRAAPARLHPIDP